MLSVKVANMMDWTNTALPHINKRNHQISPCFIFTILSMITYYKNVLPKKLIR